MQVLNQNIFLTKRLGLFLCCMESGEQGKKPFDNAFSQDLRVHTKAKDLFGGAFNFDKMNLIERAIINKSSPSF